MNSIPELKLKEVPRSKNCSSLTSLALGVASGFRMELEFTMHWSNLSGWANKF